MIQFTIPLEPIAWGRVQRDRYGTTYVPKQTRKFKADFALASKPYKPAVPLTGAIELTLYFQIARPPSIKRSLPCVRPDLDNYAKGVMDALGDFWTDDGQVVTLTAHKRYGVGSFIGVMIAQKFALTDWITLKEAANVQP